MIHARSEWWKEVDRLIMRSDRKLHECLFALTRRMREEPGGDIACCGSFLPSFVALVPNKDVPITDKETRTILKILKAVSGGARKILRIAAEIQLGLLGINWRQSTIPQFYKPLSIKKLTNGSVPLVNPSPPSDPHPTSLDKKKTFSVPNTLNRNVTVFNVFDFYTLQDKTVYWEFKAG
jgi:hypothetical protein